MKPLSLLSFWRKSECPEGVSSVNVRPTSRNGQTAYGCKGGGGSITSPLQSRTLISTSNISTMFSAVQRLTSKVLSRRDICLALLWPLGVSAQQEVQTLTGNKPRCPVCKAINDAPGLPLVWSESSNTVKPVVFGDLAVILCQQCGVLFGVKNV